MKQNTKMTLGRKKRSKRIRRFRIPKPLFRFFQLVVHLFVIVEFTRENDAAKALRTKIPLGIVFAKDSEEVQEAFKTAVLELSTMESPARLDFQMYVDIINTADAFKLSRLICHQFSRGVTVVLGFIPPEAFATFHSYANTFEVPIITPWFPESVVNPKKFIDFAVSVVPDYHRAILDIIDYYDWKNVYYIYDSHDGLLRLQQIYQTIEVAAKRTFRIAHVKKVVTAAEVVEFLAGIEHQDRWSDKVVILDAPGALCRDILVQHVRDVRLGRRNYHYFLTDVVMDENWSDQELGAIRVTGFKLLDDSRPQVKSFRNFWPKRSISAAAAILRDIVVLCCGELNAWFHSKPEYFEAIAKVVTKLNATNYECTPPSALSVHDCGEKMSRKLRNVNFEGITGHIAFSSNGQRKNFTLQVVELTNNKTMKKIGTWYDYKGFIPLVPPKPKMTPGQYDRNKTYIVTTVEEPPYIMSNTESSGMPLPFNYRGFCVELTEKLCDMLEIKCQMRLSFDGLYGLKNPNVEGGWDGAVGELIREEADMAIASLLVTVERELVIDFSKPFVTIDKKVRRPYNFFLDAFAFFSPFARNIWYCIAISAVIVSSVLWLVSRFSPMEWRILSVHEPRNMPTKGERHIPDAHVKNQFTYFNCLWYVYSSVLQQGNELSPRSAAGRVITLTWWVFTWFMVAMYTASLGASLILTEINYPANELIKTARCPRDTPDGPGPLIPEQAVERQGWVFFVDEMGRGPGNCEVIINIHKPGLQEYAVAFPKGSKLRDGVNIALQILRYNGKLAAMITKWFVRDECGNAERFPHAQELNLYHLSGLFYILIGGLVIAMFVALIEYLVYGRADVLRANLTLRAVMMATPRNTETRTPSVQLSQSERDNENEIENERERVEWNGGAYAGYYSPSSQIQEETDLDASFTTV